MDENTDILIVKEPTAQSALGHESPFVPNPQQAQQEKQYKDLNMESSPEDDISSVEFDDERDLMPEQAAIDHVREPQIEPQIQMKLSRHPTFVRPDDPSVPLHPNHTSEARLEKSKFGLGLWCEENGISRMGYSGLRELLRLLEPHTQLSNLPCIFFSY